MKKLPFSFSRSARRVVFWLHQIIGLGLGLFLGLLALSGSILIFGDPMDRSLYPDLLQVSSAQNPTPVSTATLWQRLEEAHLSSKIQRIRVPRNATSPYEVCLKSPDTACVYINPYDAHIMGSRIPDQSFKRRLFLLHSHLWSGDTGESLVGVLGILLLLMSLSGLWLWWPRTRVQAAAAPGPKENPWTQTSYRLHRWLGFTMCLFLVLSSMTGIGLAFEKPVEHFFHWISRSPQKPKPPQVAPLPKKPERLPGLGDFMGAANQALPGGEIAFVTWPKRPNDAVAVRKKMPNEWHPNGRSIVYLDPYTARVLSVDDSKNAPMELKMRYLFHHLHTGSWGGSFSQVLQCLVGFSPLVLFFSSLYMWRNRRRYRKQKNSAGS